MKNIFKKSLKIIYNKLKKYFNDDNTKNNHLNNNNNLHSNIIKHNHKNMIDIQSKSNNSYNKNNYDNNLIINKEKDLILKHNFISEEKKDISKIYTVENINNKLKTIWDILKINDNTQAEHLLKSIPSDQWVTMEEIKKKITLEFNIEYKNEKSLYPYLKTLVDINLIKINNTGKKRSWKKNIIILE
jgi:hypothetical protein